MCTRTRTVRSSPVLSGPHVRVSLPAAALPRGLEWVPVVAATSPQRLSLVLRGARGPQSAPGSAESRRGGSGALLRCCLPAIEFQGAGRPQDGLRAVARRRGIRPLSHGAQHLSCGLSRLPRGSATHRTCLPGSAQRPAGPQAVEGQVRYDQGGARGPTAAPPHGQRGGRSSPPAETRLLCKSEHRKTRAEPPPTAGG